MKSKKIISIVMTSAMMTSMFPVASYAETPTDVGTVVETRAAQPVKVDSESALTQAITNATGATTIQLSADVSLSSNLIISGEKNITVDLNGHTLSSSSKKFNVNSGSTVTIKDGANSSGTISNTTVYANSGGTLILESGNISHSNTNAVYVLNGTFTMNGGTIKGNPGIKAYSGTTNIVGGSVLKTDKAQVALQIGSNQVFTLGQSNPTSQESPYIQGIILGGGKVDFYSGTVEWVQGSKTFTTDSTISCVFKQDCSSNLPAGMMCVSNGDGTFKVEQLTEENAAAKIGTTLYASAVSAASALQDNETLVLLSDVTGDSSSALLSVNAFDATVDLNGHSVTNTNTNGIGIEMKAPNKEDKDASLKLVNNGGATTISATIPVSFASGLSTNDIEASLTGEITLNTSGEQKITLGNGVKLAYSEDAANAIANGGFLSTDSQGNAYIYNSAISALSNSVTNTATLLNNYTGSASLNIVGTGTVDLAGHVYTTSADNAINVNDSNTNVTIKNGRVISTNSNDPIGLAVFPAGGGVGGPTPLDNVSVILDNLQLSMNHSGVGIMTNGTQTNNNITLQNNSSVTVQPDSTAIYFPPISGNLIIDNSTVIGGTGIAVKGGNVTVKGSSTIQATGEKYAPTDPAPSGFNETGDAIYVEGNYNRAVNVTVESGSIISDKGHPLQKLFDENATEGQKKEILVKGGNFSEPVEEAFLDKTLTTMLISRSNPEAPISYYASAQEASKNAQPGDKVESVDSTATTYTATIKFGTGAADLVYELTEGSSFNLPAAPTKNGYTFLGWTDGTNNYQAGASIELTGNMTIEAVWREIPEYNGKYSYEVFTEVGDNGSIKVDKYATEGDKITITVSPDEAYMLDDMTITSNGKEVEFEDNGDGTYTFTMPSGDVKIEVTFAEDPNWEPEPTMPFNDVNENDWFYGAVEYVYDNGLMNGVSEDEFAPQMKLTRAMMVSVLANLEGAASSDNNAFSDVPDNAWYADAVNWAATVGVTNGFEDGTFRPNDSLTREQMAAMLYNYAAYKGYDLTAVGDLSQFADADQISAWAEDVVSWAVGADILHGMGNDMLSPTGTATRAEVAAVLANYCENVAK